MRISTLSMAHCGSGDKKLEETCCYMNMWSPDWNHFHTSVLGCLRIPANISSLLPAIHFWIETNGLLQPGCWSATEQHPLTNMPTIPQWDGLSQGWLQSPRLWGVSSPLHDKTLHADSRQRSFTMDQTSMSFHVHRVRRVRRKKPAKWL